MWRIKGKPSQFALLFLLFACSSLLAFKALSSSLQTYSNRLIQLSDNLQPKVLQLALQAYQNAESADLVKKPVLTIIDYSKPSTERRLWVFDLEEGELLYNNLVTHGVNTGDNWATQFSNVPNSRASSLGTFVTAETYYGKHGYSLRLDGLEEGINHNARQRAIVIHGASYATEDFVQQHGRLGRSWGCPALDPEVSRELIDTIKDGSVIFSYYPDELWLASSDFLQVA